MKCKKWLIKLLNGRLHGAQEFIFSHDTEIALFSDRDATEPYQFRQNRRKFFPL